MTFNQVIAALRKVRPGAELGKTAQSGKFYDQAIGMTFRRYDDLWYMADGPRGGRTMWLYYSERYKRICCGNKD